MYLLNTSYAVYYYPIPWLPLLSVYGTLQVRVHVHNPMYVPGSLIQSFSK